MKKISLAPLKEKFQKIRTNLTHINKREPLSKLSLVIVIFLDLFILISLFNGLDEHTGQLTSPDEYIPVQCREIIIEGEWVRTKKLDKLSEIILESQRDYYSPEEKKSNKNFHPVCGECIQIINNIKKNKSIINLIKGLQKEYRNYYAVNERIEELKSSYDTVLLEKISRDKNSLAETDSLRIKNEIQKKIAQQNRLLKRISSIETELLGRNDIKKLWNEIIEQQKHRESLRDDLRSSIFWFPVKKLLMQLLFLIPLFIIFYIWYSRSIKKARGLQTLVSSHLLIVVFVPIFFKIVEAVYDIIPKKLLKFIWALLLSMNLIAIWHYIIIALSIGVAMFMIYTIQKKIFSRDKLIERRIIRGQCLECGLKIPGNSKACPTCGFIQYTKCNSCGSETFVYGKFCRQCGREQI